MYLKIACHLLFSAVEQVYKASDKKHNMAILANMKLVLTQNMLELTSSDLDVELCARLILPADTHLSAGQITVPAEKFYDILKALMPKDKKNRKNYLVELVLEKDCLNIYADSNHFKLNTLPAEDFPMIGAVDKSDTVIISDKELKSIIDKTEFAIALQDVRYYLMGMSFEFANHQLTTVATDGRRLAFANTQVQCDDNFERNIIIPKKGIKELQRLLSRLIADRDKYLKKVKKKLTDDMMLKDSLSLMIGKEFMQVVLPFYDYDEAVDNNQLQTTLWIQLTTKLIEGKFPDYRRVVPKDQSNIAVMNHEQLYNMLRRVAILSDERNRSTVFHFDPSVTELTLESYNNDRDKAVAKMPVNYQGEVLEITFNIGYLIDVLDAMLEKNQYVDEIIADQHDEQNVSKLMNESFDVIFKMGQANDSVMIEKSTELQYKFIVMPIRL